MAEFSFWYTILVVAVMTLALAFELAKTEVVVFTALLALTLAGIVTVPEAFKGFSNEGMLSVGFLFIVAAALQVTGVLDSMTRIFFGKDRGSVAGKLIRFSFPVAGISAFLNNTPLVAMLTPLVKSWCKRNNFSPSKFLIPLSYVTILGGTCTLVGTSTNLVVQGLLIDYNLPRLSFFDLGIVALPTAILGILFISLFLSRLLPDHRESVAELGESTREFVVALKVGPEYAEIGKSVEAAGLRHLQGLFLFQIERNGDIIAPLEPTEKIQLNDRLFFTGLPGTIVELQRQPGLHVVQDAELDLKNYDSSEIRKLATGGKNSSWK
jgi:di/tricarboxylate transporter